MKCVYVAIRTESFRKLKFQNINSPVLLVQIYLFPFFYGLRCALTCAIIIFSNFATLHEKVLFAIIIDINKTQRQLYHSMNVSCIYRHKKAVLVYRRHTYINTFNQINFVVNFKIYKKFTKLYEL